MSTQFILKYNSHCLAMKYHIEIDRHCCRSWGGSQLSCWILRYAWIAFQNPFSTRTASQRHLTNIRIASQRKNIVFLPISYKLRTVIIASYYYIGGLKIFKLKTTDVVLFYLFIFTENYQQNMKSNKMVHTNNAIQIKLKKYYLHKSPYHLKWYWEKNIWRIWF